MVKIVISALGLAPALRVDLVQKHLVLAHQDISKGEDIVPAIDKLLKASRMDITNVVDITAECEEGASQLSCQMAQVARETFLFAQSAIKSTNIQRQASASLAGSK